MSIVMDAVKLQQLNLPNLQNPSPSKLTAPVINGSHEAFLKGYAPEDEGLYDDYPTG
jgi:hypothetical protein